MRSQGDPEAMTNLAASVLGGETTAEVESDTETADPNGITQAAFDEGIALLEGAALRGRRGALMQLGALLVGSPRTWVAPPRTPVGHDRFSRLEGYAHAAPHERKHEGSDDCPRGAAMLRLLIELWGPCAAALADGLRAHKAGDGSKALMLYLRAAALGSAVGMANAAHLLLQMREEPSGRVGEATGEEVGGEAGEEADDEAGDEAGEEAGEETGEEEASKGKPTTETLPSATSLPRPSGRLPLALALLREAHRLGNTDASLALADFLYDGATASASGAPPESEATTVKSEETESQMDATASELDASEAAARAAAAASADERYVEALQLYEYVARTVGDPEALYATGHMYQNGFGTERDPERAAEVFARLEELDPMGGFGAGGGAQGEPMVPGMVAQFGRSVSRATAWLSEVLAAPWW